MSSVHDTEQSVPLPREFSGESFIDESQSRQARALGEEVMAVVETDGFYGRGTELEAERLRTMARIADTVSLGAITRLYEGLSDRKPVVADIGAGDSTSLAHSLVGYGFDCVSVDSRLDAIEAYAKEGLPAVHSAATELSIEHGIVDVTHARFLWGWLDSGQRLQSLAEMLRVGRSDMAVAIIDYDWSTCKGPELFMQMVESLKGVMSLSGFTPDYGAELAADFDEKLSRLIDGRYALTTTRTPLYGGPVVGALPMIEQTALAYAEQLRTIGLTREADELAVNLDTLRAYIVQHPQEAVALPDIVSVEALVSDKDNRLTEAMRLYLDAIEGAGRHRFDYESLREGTDFVRTLPDILSAHRVVIALSDRMKYEARRIKALAYYKGGIVTLDAVDDGGTLVTGNDPIELVERSVYFQTIEDETNWMDGGVGMICPDPAIGIDSLPEFARIRDHSPLTFTQLDKYPFMQEPDRVVEVSGLSKNMLGGSLNDVVLAMVALADVAVQRGYQYGIMGLRESQVRLIEGIFGTSAVRRIEGEDAVHHIRLPGVKGEVQFVPMYVDGRTFVEDVHAHAAAQSGRLFETLQAMTGEILAARQTR